MYSPHIEAEQRMLALTRHVAATGESAYAAMDRTAIYYMNESVAGVASSAGRGVVRLTADDGSVRITEVGACRSFPRVLGAQRLGRPAYTILKRRTPFERAKLFASSM